MGAESECRGSWKTQGSRLKVPGTMDVAATRAARNQHGTSVVRCAISGRRAILCDRLRNRVSCGQVIKRRLLLVSWSEDEKGTKDGVFCVGKT